MLVTEEQELSIGKEAAPSLKWDFGGYYEDSNLETYLEAIVRDIWSNSERPHLPVEFHIQNTSVPNAFALPGYVAITRGLLSEMTNEAQFAAVMGHEVGHVMARHTAQRISRMQLQQIGLAIGSVALQGQQGADALLTVGSIGSSLILLKYDRGQEIQSDRLGVKYMATLGYNPVEAVSAHKVLEDSVNNYLKRLGKSPREDNFISSIMSTHPRTEVRLSEIKEMISELPPYTLKKDGIFSNRFNTALKELKKVNEIYFKYDKAELHYQNKEYKKSEDLLTEAINLDSSQAPFYNLLGFIMLQQKKYSEANSSFKKALQISPRYQPSIYGQGLFHYYNENYNSALYSFKASIKEFPEHAQSHFGLGKTHFQLKEYSNAIPYLSAFAQAAANNEEVHGMLGISYDKTGKIKPAVISYRNQLRVAPDSEMGRYARNRLKVLEPMLKK